MRFFFVMVMVTFVSSPVWAADSDAPPPATMPAASKVIDDDAQPAPVSKASLSDLRDQEIQTENDDEAAHENSAGANAETDPDACTAKDVSATMRIPENLIDTGSAEQTPGSKSVHWSGNDAREKPANKNIVCKAAYDKMTDACYKGMPCSGCEDALKQFSTACGYVGRVEPMDALPAGLGASMGKGGGGGGRTLDGRRNVPVNKLPQK
jgi:hypothetical protein